MKKFNKTNKINRNKLFRQLIFKQAPVSQAFNMPFSGTYAIEISILIQNLMYLEQNMDQMNQNMEE